MRKYKNLIAKVDLLSKYFKIDFFYYDFFNIIFLILFFSKSGSCVGYTFIIVRLYKKKEV